MQEGEIITQIEEIDEGEFLISAEKLNRVGWWSGTNAAGKSGLFPSNYCEMMEDEAVGDAQAVLVAPAAPGAPALPPMASVAAREQEEQAEGLTMVAAYEWVVGLDDSVLMGTVMTQRRRTKYRSRRVRLSLISTRWIRIGGKGGRMALRGCSPVS